MLASSVSDMEGLRIATDNRLRALTTKDADEDGVIRGLGLPDDDPNVKRMIDVSDSVKETESKAIKALEKAVKDYSLYDWLTLQKVWVLRRSDALSVLLVTRSITIVITVFVCLVSLLVTVV